jgi:1-deoxy-D-xylulose-5-phosphate reductoisomerase
MMVKSVTLLGSTGSIGLSTLDVISRHPHRYRVTALTANTHVDRLFEQVKQFTPQFAVLRDTDAAQRLDRHIKQAGLETEVLSGVEGLIRVAEMDGVDYVMAAIVGAAGLQPTLAAARAGKRVLLANKEALVMSGRLFMDEVKQNGAELLPIDSEHNAIFQCMPGNFANGLGNVGVERILLTASGGPFRTRKLSELNDVTPEQACAHPNWDMGRKISVDSATMMNKGLEVIEACWLFNTGPDVIEVVIHPQSVIHSMVQYNDGSVLAQLGNPDMRTPIAHALAWPERVNSGVEPLDVFAVKTLDFERPDLTRFPCLRLAMEAAATGATAPTVLNAANEVAVAAFLDKQLRYTDIANVIESVMERTSQPEADSLDVILRVDAEARTQAERMISSMPMQVS